MDRIAVPAVFLRLQSDECIDKTELLHTRDGFWMACRSLSEILARKGILDFPDTDGTRLACDRFYDDWFLYAVPGEHDFVYSLVKLREQEHDAENGIYADGDTPGVTVSFIPFSCEILLSCLSVPTDENRQRLDREIDCVAARRGQQYHESLKRYFIDPRSEGPYLVADQYARQIASFAENGMLDVPLCYGEMAKKPRARLPRFIDALNQAAGRIVCDHEKIYFQNAADVSEEERAAILATHTGNTSRYSFAAEVEYHARFLTPLAKIKIPFCKKSLYESAVRADMTIGDAGYRKPTPYYRDKSGIVRRQYGFHKND